MDLNSRGCTRALAGARRRLTTSRSRRLIAGRSRRLPARATLTALAAMAAGLAAMASTPGTALAAGPARGYTWVGAAPANGTVPLALPLKANLAGLERFAAAVSTPGSPVYGQYQPVSELARRFGAPAAERRQVTAYLQRAGATGVKLDVTGLFVDATVTVSQAQRMFGTALADYRTARAARFVAPRAPARIPAAIRSAVTGVVGLDTRPVFGSSRAAPVWPHTAAGRVAPSAQTGVTSGYPQRTGTPAGCPAATGQSGFTPNQYLAAYGYEPLHSAGLEGQGERVALIEIDGFKESDLRTFAGCFGLPIPQINGYGVNLSKPLPPGGESTLDLEVLDTAAPKLRAVDVYESKPSATQVLQSLTAPLSKAATKPDVISASLGSCEPATLDTIGHGGLNIVEGALATAAASGISVLASSGDDGSSSCLSPTGQPLGFTAASFPASSPWVTGVGGTNIALNGANQIIGQVVWNDSPVVVAAGGGGVSGLFGRPNYQNGVVAPNHRIVPDVSMLADVAPGYEIYCSVSNDCLTKSDPDPWTQVGGTSAAAPLLAGGLALIDQDLRLHGRQNVGLANPLLYSIARSQAAGSVLSDVVTGDNDLGPSVIGRPFGCCSAAPGFDWASGLGSVNVDGLSVAANALVPRLASVSVKVPTQRHPVASRHLTAKVSCSQRCLATAYARIQVGHSSRRITVRAGAYTLRSAGRRSVTIRFSGATLSKLRTALARGQRLTATVYGAILDPTGSAIARTRGVAVRIRH